MDKKGNLGYWKKRVRAVYRELKHEIRDKKNAESKVAFNVNRLNIEKRALNARTEWMTRAKHSKCFWPVKQR